MDSISTFGTYLREKRQQNNISLRQLAEQVGLSHIYLYNIECGKKAPPNDVAIKQLGKALKLDKESLYTFFDMAAQCKSSIDSNNYYLPVDISQYLNENEDARNVIREANKKEQHNSFWNDLLKEIKK